MNINKGGIPLLLLIKDKETLNGVIEGESFSSPTTKAIDLLLLWLLFIQVEVMRPWLPQDCKKVIGPKDKKKTSFLEALSKDQFGEAGTNVNFLTYNETYG